ncbi:hypothetical protein GCM10029964_062570 [Kibdelosporangium lantanae]
MQTRELAARRDISDSRHDYHLAVATAPTLSHELYAGPVPLAIAHTAQERAVVGFASRR